MVSIKYLCKPVKYDDYRICSFFDLLVAWVSLALPWPGPAPVTPVYQVPLLWAENLLLF